MADFRVVDAAPEDAPLIAWAVMEAVGREIISCWADESEMDAVREMFARLAARTDSQYSYLNARIAVAPDGTKAGVCVSYPGGDVMALRRPFFREANRTLGWGMTDEEVESLPGETSGEEFYLDSLAVLPEFRGKGIGALLIADAREKARRAGLPLGLLVADDNPRARKLYEDAGFRAVGRRFFAGEEMTNMRMPL